MTENRIYIAIDLKSFYAGVECVERGLDPMTTDLVVADPTRSNKTICLAVSPSLKQKGVKNRCRLFEIPKSYRYIIAPPRMQKYIDYAADIYGLYLNFFSKDDIHVYSIDEVFIDVTDYLKLYQKTSREMAVFLMNEISEKIGVRATAGIGTNLYLAKVALDIMAKHSTDFIGELDEGTYRQNLWEHEPITDFWRIGGGIAKILRDHCIYNMGQLAHADEDTLYQIFGKDAELLIDHAWGREPTLISDIKKYRPETTCLSSGQVLPRDYSYDETALVVREMMREMCLEMVEKKVRATSVSLYLGLGKSDENYASTAKNGGIGSFIASHSSARGTVSLSESTNSSGVLVPKISKLYEEITKKSAKIRRIYLNCNRLVSDQPSPQTSLFDLSVLNGSHSTKKNHQMEEAMISIKQRYGKNAILMGEDLEEPATQRERNQQIGGHKSGH